MFCRSFPTAGRVAAAAALAFFVSAGQAADAPAKPDATESLFWQSTEKLATPEAYRAYLANYPHGFFVPLANAALAAPKSAPTVATGAAVLEPAAGDGQLKPFHQDADNGAVTFELGQTFDGPIALTVGRLGARRQIVLPAGQWVALAVENDARMMRAAFSSHVSTVRMKVTTATFGKFSGNRLVSLMRFNFPAEKSPAVAWSAIGTCDKVPELLIRSAPVDTKSQTHDECAALGAQSNPLGDDSEASTRTLESLKQLGATVHGPALVATLGINEENQRGFLSATRYE